MGRRKGFTLIELLVVIAIIALLLAVVVPSLRKAKEAAKGVSCRSNVRQMSIAFGTYSVDNDGRIFPFSYVGEYGYWFRNIAPYLGDKDYQTSTELQTSGVMKVGICPNTKVQTDDNSGTAPDNKTTWYWGSENIIGSYGVNAWVLPDPDGHVSTWGGGAISAAAAEKRLFSQYAQIRGDVGVIADSFRMDCWPSTPSNVKVPTAKQLIELTDMTHDLPSLILRFTVDRHNMAVNVGFVDGSVEKVRIEDLYTTKWNNEDGPVQVEVPRPE